MIIYLYILEYYCEFNGVMYQLLAAQNRFKLNKQNEGLSNNIQFLILTEFTRAISREQMVRHAWHYLVGEYVTMQGRRDSEFALG